MLHFLLVVVKVQLTLKEMQNIASFSRANTTHSHRWCGIKHYKGWTEAE